MHRYKNYVYLLLVLSGLLLASTQQIGTHSVAVAQNVEIDTSQPPVVVNSSSNLGTLTVHDGRIIIIRTGAASGLMYYSSSSSATIDDVDVINGPGGVGRYLRLAGGSGAAALADVANKVADVTALLATSPSDNQLYQTLGYTTEGVGSNLYRYDAASSATIDGGFVLPGPGGTLSFSGTTFNGNAGTGGRFIAVDQTVADVTKFGALGDGSTDDTNAILRTFSKGGATKIPDGVYAHTGISITTSMRLLGSRGASLLSTTTDAALLITSANVSIEGIEIDGDGVAANGIWLSDDSHDCSITNCHIHDITSAASTANGIIFSDGCYNLEIVDNKIETINGTTGVPARGIRGDGNSAPSTAIYGVTISRNRIDYVAPVDDADGIVIQGWTATCDVLIDSNIIRRTAKRAIKLQSPGCVCTSNRITLSNVGGGSDPYSGISIYASETVVANNVIQGPATFAGIGIGSGGIGQIVTGNRINFGTHSNTSCDGINTDTNTSNYGTIAGNSISGTHRSGVRLSHACVGMSICNNVSNGASTSAYITTAAISSCSFVGNVGISHTHYLLHDNNVGTTSKCVLVGNSSDGGGFGAVSATFLADCQSYATGNGTTGVVTGSASPESSITAPVGWLYLRTGGGASTTLYVKESGTGNTGWVAK